MKQDGNDAELCWAVFQLSTFSFPISCSYLIHTSRLPAAKVTPQSTTSRTSRLVHGGNLTPDQSSQIPSLGIWNERN